MTPEERCEEHKRVERIEAAFRAGDLDALRAAVEDPSTIPNGHIPFIGSCLVHAIYRSPLPFIRTLLAIGANPNLPADDGFPPLIAALAMTRDEPGAARRTDVDEVIRLLLANGADPNQRGTNGYTPLHMAVAERNTLAVLRLLEGGADPDLRTRIDEDETAGEMAAAAGLTEIADLLARRGEPVRRRLRAGLTLLVDLAGSGGLVERQRLYRIRLRMWLNHGEPVRWPSAWGPVGEARLEDNGETLFTRVPVDRHSLANGLFYGLDGMRVGGTRRLEISPHLAYGDRGVPGVIPPNAVLTAEITILAPVATGL